MTAEQEKLLDEFTGKVREINAIVAFYSSLPEDVFIAQYYGDDYADYTRLGSNDILDMAYACYGFDYWQVEEARQALLDTLK